MNKKTSVKDPGSCGGCDSGLPGKKPVPGGCGCLRCCVCAGTVPGAVRRTADEMAAVYRIFRSHFVCHPKNKKNP